MIFSKRALLLLILLIIVVQLALVLTRDLDDMVVAGNTGEAGCNNSDGECPSGCTSESDCDCPLFYDSFESDLANWEINLGNSSDEVILSGNNYYDGSKSLKMKYDGGNLTSANHWLDSEMAGTVEVWFYDKIEDSPGVSFGVANEGLANYIHLIAHNISNYQYRIDADWYDTGITRTVGWHKFELLVTPKGSVGKIDGKNLANIAVNSNLTSFNVVSFGTTWGNTGVAYFDELKIKGICPIPDSPDGIYYHFAKKVMDLYEDTDFSGAIESAEPNHLATGLFRSLLAQAMTYEYMYFRNGNTQYLDKAISFIAVSADNYHKWGRQWLGTVPGGYLAQTSWWIWEELDTNTKSKVKYAITQEANFYADVLDAYKIGGEVPSWFEMNGYIWDTKAEENGVIAEFLAFAANMFPNEPDSARWDEAARCFAFHTFTTGEEYCGITTQTINTDYQLENHGLKPSPLYAIGTIGILQQGSWAYIYAGNEIPPEFNHNKQEVWNANVEPCYNWNTFAIKPECHGGEDWGDVDIWRGMIVVSYGAGMEQDPKMIQIEKDALDYLYLIKGDMLLRNVDEPLIFLDEYTQRGDSLDWFLNIETHGQIPSKSYLWHMEPGIDIVVGDINQDKIVDIQDYILLSNAFGTNDQNADLNDDTIVDIQDYIILSNNFGKTG